MMIASRPRTLVIMICLGEIEAAMLGPAGNPLGHRTTRRSGTTLQADLEALWPHLEPLGEFDRITVSTDASLDQAWDASALMRELERQTLRPVRVMAAAELCWRQLIRGVGVELVLGLAVNLDSSLFFAGTFVPGLVLANHRFRKKRTYGEYLAPRVLDRKGVDEWNRRIDRVVAEVLAVWNPTTLYLAGSNATHVTCDLPSNVVVCRQSTSLDGAIGAWQTTRG